MNLSDPFLKVRRWIRDGVPVFSCARRAGEAVLGDRGHLPGLERQDFDVACECEAKRAGGSPINTNRDRGGFVREDLQDRSVNIDVEMDGGAASSCQWRGDVVDSKLTGIRLVDAGDGSPGCPVFRLQCECESIGLRLEAQVEFGSKIMNAERVQGFLVVCMG